MKKEIILLAVMFSYVSLWGQVTIGGQGFGGGSFGNSSYVKSTERNSGMTSISFEQSKETKLKNIYLSEVFFKGNIETENGDKEKSAYFRYNITTDQIEQMSGNKQISIIDKPLQAKKISFGGKEFLYELIVDKKGIYAGYFDLIVDGDAQLLLRRYGKSRTDNYLSRYGGGGGTGKEIYTVQKSWYYQINGKGVKKLKSNKKTLLKIFADKKDSIREFLKKQKPNLKTKEGKKTIFEYYNSLKQNN